MCVCVYIYIYIYIHMYIHHAAPPSEHGSGKSSAEPCRGGCTTRKANIHVGDVRISQPEQVLKFSR